MESFAGAYRRVEAVLLNIDRMNRHMFFDGVFDQMEGMTHIPDGAHSPIAKLI